MGEELEEKIEIKKSSKKKNNNNLEKLQNLEKRKEKIIEEKSKIETLENSINQEKINVTQEIYEKIFEILEIPVKTIIETSNDLDEVIYKIKEYIGLI